MKYIYRFLRKLAKVSVMSVFFKTLKLLIIISVLYTNLVSVGVANSTSSIKITAKVVKFCTMRATPFTFGTYGKKDLLAQSTVTVTCTSGTNYYIGVSPNRSMINHNKEFLLYSVHAETNKSRILGNAIGQNTISGVGTGKPQVITIYATVKGGQAVGRGLYQDMLSISLNF